MKHKENMLKTYTIVLLLSVVGLCCSKKEELNTRYLQAYVNSETFPANEVILHYGYFTDGKIYGTVQQKIPISITKATTANVTLTFKLVDSLVDVYNRINKTSLRPAPADAYTLSTTGSITIPAGKLQPDVPLSIKLTDPFKFSDNQGYLLGLVLDKLESADKGAVLSPSQSIVYIKIMPANYLLSLNAKDGDNDSLKTITFFKTPSGTSFFTPTPIMYGYLNEKPGVAFSQPLSVGDASAVTAYNAANATAYSLLPATNYTLSDNKAVFENGKDTSALITLSAVNNVNQLTLKNYLLPVTAQPGQAYLNKQKTKAYLRLIMDSVVASLRITTTSTVKVIPMPYPIASTGATAPPLPKDVIVVLAKAVPFPVDAKVLPGGASDVTAYNTANGTSYLLLPANNYTITGNGAFTVPVAGTRGTLTVTVKNVQTLDATKKYILPLLMEENVVFANKQFNALYVTVNSDPNNIDPANSGLTGSTMSRSGWSVTTSGSRAANPVTRVLDGDNATAWDSDGVLPGWMQLDMGSLKTVKGFSIVPSYEYTRDNILAMDVLSSVDGINWTTQGKYAGSATLSTSTAANPDLKTVKFISPVTARYFKFSVTSTTQGRMTGMAEINGVE